MNLAERFSCPVCHAQNYNRDGYNLAINSSEVNVTNSLEMQVGRLLQERGLKLVLAESCLLSVLGGLLGLGLAWMLTSRGDPTGGLLPLSFIPPRQLLVGAGLTVALGMVTGVLPALQAMRLRVADALRKM